MWRNPTRIYRHFLLHPVQVIRLKRMWRLGGAELGTIKPVTDTEPDSQTFFFVFFCNTADALANTSVNQENDLHWYTALHRHNNWSLAGTPLSICLTRCLSPSGQSLILKLRDYIMCAPHECYRPIDGSADRTVHIYTATTIAESVPATAGWRRLYLQESVCFQLSPVVIPSTTLGWSGCLPVEFATTQPASQWSCCCR